VVRIPRDEESKARIKNIAIKNWSTASKVVFKHPDMKVDLSNSLRAKVASEFNEYVKSGSILDLKDPDEIAGFSNKIFMKEVRSSTILFRGQMTKTQHDFFSIADLTATRS
jgi:hypothetical protein